MATLEHPTTRNLATVLGDSSTRTASYVPFALVLLSFTAITVWLAAKLNLYIDELYSLHTTSHGFRYALDQALGFEQQPPLFFLALTAWRAIDPSDFFARLFSIGCSLATLFVVWRFARRRFAALPDWLAPLAVALNPFFIWAALDIRVYAAIVLLSALLMTLFFDAFYGESLAPGKIVAFTVVAIAALYTQYFIGAMFVGFGFALLFGTRGRRVVPFVASMIVVLSAILPLLIGQVGHEFGDATAVHVVTARVLATRMLSSTLSFVYPHTWTNDLPHLANVAYLAIVLATFAFVLREPRRSENVRALGIVVASIVGFFLLVILGLRAPLEMPRHISTLFIPAMLLALGSFAAIRNVRSRRIVSAAYLIVLLVFSLADDAKTYRAPLSNQGDWQRVGDYLNAHVESSEPIAVFDTEGVLGVRHYYHGAAPIVPIPAPQNFTVFDRRAFAIHDERELAKVFPAASTPTGRAWLVFGVSACTMIEVGNSCTLLESYLAQHFRIAQELEFNGTVVRELQRKGEPERAARPVLRDVGLVRQNGF